MDIKSFFHPSSIAIVGVSTNAKKVGHLVAKNMIDQGYKGKLYFLHPEATEILGKKVYKELDDIREPIDLVILAVPAKIAINYLKVIHSIGCKNVIMYAAGFKETSEEGAQLEQELANTAHQYDLTLLGPNCLGFINTKDNINATFLKGTSPSGNIGFISQSGALGSVMVDYFAGHVNLGFSYFVSLGNKTTLDEADTLAYLKDDPDTMVVGMYLEDVKHGDKFRKILLETCKVKPVVILKSGSTQEGSKAALSHTGGLVGSDEVYEALFRQCGGIRASSFSEFLNILRLFSFKRVPSSRSTLVLSNAGGVGVLLADELIKQKLSLVTVSKTTTEELNTAFQDIKKISVHNPIDLLGDASAFDYQKAISSTLHEKNVGSIIVLLTPQANTEILKTAKVIASAQQAFDKPIYPVFMGKKSLVKTHDFFEEQFIPYFKTYDGVPAALNKINTYLEWKKEITKDSNRVAHSLAGMIAHKHEIDTIVNLHKGQPFLDLQYSLRVIQMAGIPIAELIQLKQISDIHNYTGKIPLPVAVKIASKEITHKTEVGGVITNVKSVEELEQAFRKITSRVAGTTGVYVQTMVKGQELFLGAKRDNVFGTVLVFGLGGIYTELLKEVTQLVYPFSYSQFEQAIKDTKMNHLLTGFRGSKPVDKQLLYEIVYKTGNLLETTPGIKEIDINPLFVTGATIVAPDCRVILQ